MGFGFEAIMKKNKYINTFVRGPRPNDRLNEAKDEKLDKKLREEKGGFLVELGMAAATTVASLAILYHVGAKIKNNYDISNYFSKSYPVESRRYNELSQIYTRNGELELSSEKLQSAYDTIRIGYDASQNFREEVIGNAGLREKDFTLDDIVGVLGGLGFSAFGLKFGYDAVRTYRRRRKNILESKIN